MWNSIGKHRILYMIWIILLISTDDGNRRFSTFWVDFRRSSRLRRSLMVFRFLHIFLNMYPFVMTFAPLESWDWELSNGTNFIKNGYILRKLWGNRNDHVYCISFGLHIALLCFCVCPCFLCVFTISVFFNISVFCCVVFCFFVFWVFELHSNCKPSVCN